MGVSTNSLKCTKKTSSPLKISIAFGTSSLHTTRLLNSRTGISIEMLSTSRVSDWDELLGRQPEIDSKHAVNITAVKT
jgi:hypothetical protein